MTLLEIKDNAVAKALLRHQGNVRKAALELGISNMTLYRILARKRKQLHRENSECHQIRSTA